MYKTTMEAVRRLIRCRKPEKSASKNAVCAGHVVACVRGAATFPVADAGGLTPQS